MFCQSCGAQTSGAFCTKCGARTAEAAAPPAQASAPPQAYAPPPPAYVPAPQPQQFAPAPQYSQPLPPPAKAGSGLKILFIVLGVMAVLGMLGIGALWYGWHVVKETAKTKGVDIDSFTETRRGPARHVDACSLLSKEELSQLVGIKVDRTQSSGSGTHTTCAYYSEAAIDQNATSATDAINRIKEHKDTGNNDVDQQKALEEVGKIVRGMAGTQANGLVTSIDVETENPKAVMAGLKIAMGVMTMGVDKEKDKETAKALREDIKGVGDEAIMGPLASVFIFRKGDVAVTIDGRALTGGRDTEIAIGKRIASKL